MPTTAADVMTSPAIVVGPHASLADIATLLSSKHISAVPVCNADGSVAGLISEADLLKPFAELTKQRQDWWLAVVAEGEELSQQFLDYIRRDPRTASDIMSRDVETADEQASLPHLAELMMAKRVHRIPILRDGRVVGIVSRSDLVAAIARAPGQLI